MKVMSVRFNAYQSDYIKVQAKICGIHAAGYVREMIEREMQAGHFLNYFKVMDDQIIPSHNNPNLIYTLMIYKLMEQLVLNQEEGQQKQQQAHQETLAWLERLMISPVPKKSCKLNIWVHPETLYWLTEEAKLLKKSVAAIIRRIVFLNAINFNRKTLDEIEIPLTKIQEETLKTVLMTFTLLKSYIVNAYEGSTKLVENCCESAKTLYNKLYPSG
jgi:hypothetical protein